LTFVKTAGADFRYAPVEGEAWRAWVGAKE
jgi:hypothetical protein